MKTLVPVFAAILGWSSWAQPMEPVPLKPLSALTALSNAEASQHMRVSFQATVTYYRPYAQNLFVQDGDAAIFVHPAIQYKLSPGDRVLVEGTMRESFRPFIGNARITVLGRAQLPTPIRPSFESMIRAETDCKLVTVRAIIQSVDLVPNLRTPISTTDLSLLVDGVRASATIDNDDPTRVMSLLDSEVELTGVQSGIFDNKVQETGLLFHVQSLDQIKILKQAESDPWSIPITPMDRVLVGYRRLDQSTRLRAHGTITYYQPGMALVLQDGSKSLWITTDSWAPLHVGAVADAIGFPAVENGFLVLTHAEMRETPEVSPVTPLHSNWRQLATGGNDGPGHIFDLVSIDGKVVTQVRQATQDEYVIESDGHLFSAFFRHPGPLRQTHIPPMRAIPAGTHIRVTGICMLTDANPFNGEVPFNILMRNADDIVVVARPTWLNVGNLAIIVGLLLCAVIAIGVRSLILERRVRRKNAALAYLEQRRSRILEDINGTRPLAEVIEEITDVVSFNLHGAPCWCAIAGGATLGNPPDRLNSLRIVPCEVPSRAGTPLGTIYAAFDMLTKPLPEHDDALSMGASLASLAISTRRLYSDLLHRSEFDLLTDVRNRFSLEMQLDQLIELARETAGIFGLIYIDFDRFKELNDEFGHNAGDLYLQAAAARMKRQLRPGDILARLGGDEFAVLVPVVRNRAEVQEIAARLEHCFNEPFSIEEDRLSGSASIGFALYPEDAETKDALLREADDAMYAVKRARRTDEGAVRVPPAPKTET
jgi:diguanylate cyclase (GGDEF)-like protein